MVMQGATLATRYSARVAESFNFSRYVVGFLVIAVISILPELLISVNAALGDDSSFGLGLILGSNIADLTLIVALVALCAGRGLKVEPKIIKNHWLYPFILVLPLILGLDGAFTRVEGGALVLVGIIFYYLSIKKEGALSSPGASRKRRAGDFLWLVWSLCLLLVGSHFAVTSVTTLAGLWGVSTVFIAMLLVALGTTIPELSFSIKAVRQKNDSLAVGDLLGTVLADATIVIGLIALIRPYTFPRTTIYIGGVFMVAAAFILFSFMRSGRKVTLMEAFALFVLWATFAAVEFIILT
jgi:cation:H+ antiporter